LLIPSFRDKLSRNAQDWLGETARPMSPRYDDQTDIFINGQHTFANEMRIVKPEFHLPRQYADFGTRLTAEDAYYRPPEDDRPGGYLLCGVTQPDDLADQPSVADEDRLVILSPCDTPWLEEDQCFVVSRLSFEHIEGGTAWRRYSSTGELIEALRNPALGFGPDVRVTVHSRFVQPLLDVTLLFLGLPLVLTRENRNVFLAIGLCLLLVGAFFVVVMACHSLGANYVLLSPALAAWCPLMIFLPLAVLISDTLRQ